MQHSRRAALRRANSSRIAANVPCVWGLVKIDLSPRLPRDASSDRDQRDCDLSGGRALLYAMIDAL
jgi:hypothetical protein